MSEDIRESKEARKKMLVIGADTVVVLDGKILGKPKDEADAFQMLSALQGRAHQVYTGVAMLDYDENGNSRSICDAKRTDVYVHAMTEAEIRRYIDTGGTDGQGGKLRNPGTIRYLCEKYFRRVFKRSRPACGTTVL